MEDGILVVFNKLSLNAYSFKISVEYPLSFNIVTPPIHDPPPTHTNCITESDNRNKLKQYWYIKSPKILDVFKNMRSRSYETWSHFT